MTDDPDSDPLGATPALPEPDGDSKERASSLLQKLVNLQRGDRDPPAEEPLERGVPQASGRRYELALEVIAQTVAAAEHEAVEPEASGASGVSHWGDDAVAASDDSPADSATDDALAVAEERWGSDEEGDQSLELLARPPAGAPAVRPSVPTGKGVDVVSQEALERAAQSAMLVSEGDAAAFEIAFRDDVFEELTCRIEVDNGRVIATFSTPDTNTRRLLESEAGRLRVQLEERGLRVEEVKVAMANPE